MRTETSSVSSFAHTRQSLARARALATSRSRSAVTSFDHPSAERWWKVADELRQAITCGSDHHVLVRADDGTFAFPIIRCGRKFCPSCSLNWSSRYTRALLPSFLKVNPQHVRHVTLTVPNADAGDLRSSMQDLRTALRAWRDRGRRTRCGHYFRRLRGYAMKIELTWSAESGWHPHAHVLLDIPGGLTFDRNSHEMKTWLRITEKLGRPAHSAAQHITSPNSSGAAVREFAKYAAKPVDIRSSPLPALLEFVEACRRFRWTSHFGSIRPSKELQRQDGVKWSIIGSVKGLKAQPSQWLSNTERAALVAFTESQQFSAAPPPHPLEEPLE